MASSLTSKLQNKKIFVTGATGYLGSHITDLLLKSSSQVQVIGTTRTLKNQQRLNQFKQSLS